MTEAHGREGVKKKCVWCGKVFVDYTRNHSQKYCSLKCRYEAEEEARRKREKSREWKVCNYCGYTFRSQYDYRTQYYLWSHERCPRCGKVAVK